jgi:hypothetical protein
MRKFQKCTKCNEELPKMHNIIWGTYKNAKHPMRKFQICTKSHENLPKMHKISWLTWNNAGFCAYLEVPHGILCIFGSSS